MSESRPSALHPPVGQVRLGPRAHTSLARTGTALLLVLVGIAWIVVYLNVAGPSTDGDEADAGWATWAAGTT